MLYQFTSPVEVPSRVGRGVAGVEFVGSIWLSTVFKSKKTLV